jgi:hypothetical protein
MKTENEEVKNVPSTHVLPDMDTLEEEEIPVSSQYWEPRKEGSLSELKGVILGFKVSDYPKVDKVTGDMSVIELECAEIAAQLKDKKGTIYYENFRNGAVLLVSSIKDAVDSGRIVLGQTPVKIEYTGVRKSGSGNSMDKFRITILK